MCALRTDGRKPHTKQSSIRTPPFTEHHPWTHTRTVTVTDDATTVVWRERDARSRVNASTISAKSGSVWSKWYVAMQYVCALRADVENRTQKDSREHERSSKADQKGPQ